MIMQSAVSEWAALQPKTIACLNYLHGNGVRLAVFCSRFAHLAAQSQGIHPEFEPQDTDLIMPKEDFDLAVKLLKVTPKTRIMRLITGDGHTLSMLVREAIYHSDSKIQLVQPLTSLASKGLEYHTAFTAKAAAARQFYETKHGVVPLCDFADAIFFYGITQRTDKGKDDTQKAALIQAIAPKMGAYGKARAREMNIDNRVLDYLRKATLLSPITARNKTVAT